MSVVSFGTDAAPLARRRATEEQFAHFTEGVSAVLQQWTALGLVMSHCDAGAGTSLFQEIIQWFMREGEVYSDELELFFEDFFSQARSVIVEDDSLKEVADIIYEMYCLCGVGDYSKVQLYKSMASVYQQQNILAQCRVFNDDDVRFEVQNEGGVEGGVIRTTGECISSSPGATDRNGVEECVPDALLDVEAKLPILQEMRKEEEEVAHPQRQQQKKRKNAFQRSSGGWNTVC